MSTNFEMDFIEDKGFPVRGLILKTPVEGLACEVSSERGSIQKF